MRLDFHIADNAGTPHVSITDAESGDALFQSIFSVARCELAEEISKRFNSHASLIDALRRMRTEFYVHDCLTNVDCRRCKALVMTEIALGLPEAGAVAGDATRIPVIFEMDGYDTAAEATGSIHFFCSPECREASNPAVWNPCKAGEQPLSDVLPETVCETCGKVLVAGEAVSEPQHAVSYGGDGTEPQCVLDNQD